MEQPLNAIRYLVVAAAKRGAKHVDVMVEPGISIVIKESFDGCWYMGGQFGNASLRPCTGYQSQYRAAAVTVGRYVLVISNTQDGERGSICTLLLWERLEGSDKARTVARVVFAIGSSSLATGRWLLKPVWPSEEKDYGTELYKILSLISSGYDDLLGLIMETGMHARSVYLVGLNPSLQLAADNNGCDFRLIPAGNPITYRATTPVANPFTDLRVFLGSILHPSTGVGVSLQTFDIHVEWPPKHITRQVKKYERVMDDLPACPGKHCTFKLMLGYDESDGVPTPHDTAYGICIYINGALEDLHFKVPSMLASNKKRLLGHCVINNASHVPKTLYWLRDRKFKPVRAALASCVDDYYTKEAHKRKWDDVQKDEGGVGADRVVCATVHDFARFLQASAEPATPVPARNNTRTAGKLTTAHQAHAAHDQHTAGQPGKLTARKQGPVDGLAQYRATSQLQQAAQQERKSNAAMPPPTWADITRADWRNMMHELLQTCMDTSITKGVFNQPVDPVALNIPDYFDVVKTPMDFGSILKLLKQGAYTHFSQVVEHIFLVFDNCRTYNSPDNEYHILANHMEKKFLNALKAKLPALETAAVADPAVSTPLEAFAGFHALIPSPPAEAPAWCTGLWPSVSVVRYPDQLIATIRPYSREGVEATMRLITNRIDTIRKDTTVQRLKVVHVTDPAGDVPMQTDNQKQPVSMYTLAVHKHAQMSKCSGVQNGRNAISVVSPKSKQLGTRSVPTSPFSPTKRNHDNDIDVMHSTRDQN